MQMAYRILVATGEATDAEKLIPIEWAHLAGVNYNTIGDAGEEFLSGISKDARVKVKTTLNPMGFDIDNVSKYGLDDICGDDNPLGPSGQSDRDFDGDGVSNNKDTQPCDPSIQ